MFKPFSLCYCFGWVVWTPTIADMKQLKSSLYALFLSLLIAGSSCPGLASAAVTPMAATPAVPSGLSLAQIKVTGDEFIILQNNTATDISDLCVYSLKAFNNVNPLAVGVSNGVQQLPATSLATGQRLILSATTRNTCGAAIAGKLSLSLVDGGGFLEILQATNGASIVGDSVSWSSGAAGVIQNVPSSTKDLQGLYYRYANGSVFNWQLAYQDPVNYCQLGVLSTTSGGSTKIIVPSTSLIIAIDSAPATIVLASSDPEADTAKPDLPPADIGLKVPEITELLPNPAGSGTDASNEFIELYNPNDRPFDLSGFKLQSGLKSLHVYTFSTGAVLPSQSFTSFNTAATGLSLSNSGGRAQLLDPSGNLLVSTDIYGTAADGQSWALANGHWYWSLTPTPSAANLVTLMAPVVKLPAAPSPVAASAPKSKTLKAAKLASPTATRAAKSAKATTAKALKKPKTTTKTIAVTPTAAAVTARPVQAKVIALVVGLAVLYGAYEYRADLANGFHQLRSKHGFGRPDWRQIARRRNRGTD